MTQYNQQLIYDFEQSILHLNTQHKSSISQIKKELLPLWKDIKDYDIRILLHRRKYRQIESEKLILPSQLYIHPRTIRDFLLYDKKLIEESTSLNPTCQKALLKDNFNLLFSFSFLCIKVFEMPIAHGRKNKIVYRIKLKFYEQDDKLIEYTVSQLQLLDKHHHIETLQHWNSYIILTTMDKKLAKSIRSTFLAEYKKLWKPSTLSKDAFSTPFDITYPSESNIKIRSKVSNRFESFINKKYPSPSISK